MIKRPRCLVLLATYNGAAHLQAQLDSILSQSLSDVRIVIRDDGSSDQTLDIIRNYSQKFGNITLLEDEASGGSGARSFMRLIANVKVEPDDVVFLCDQDDIWLREKMETAIRHISQGIDLYSSSLMSFEHGSDKRYIIKSHFSPKKYDYLFQGLSAGCTYAMSYELVQTIRRRLYTDNWYFENDYSHDWLIYTFARVGNFKIFHDPTPSILYRQHDNNVQGSLIGLPGIIYRLKNISAPWYIGQILKNGELLEKNSDAQKLIEAVKRKKHFYLTFRIFQLRRGYLDCLILYLFLLTRRQYVSEIC